MLAQDAGAGSRSSKNRIQPIETEEKQNAQAMEDGSAFNDGDLGKSTKTQGASECATHQATLPTHQENLISRKSSIRGSEKQERVCIGGVKYKLDESHFMSTFVWDRDGLEKKMLRYDLKKLVRFGGIATMLCDGTIFTMDHLLASHVSVYLLVLVGIFLTMKFGMDEEDLIKYDTDALVKLAANVNGLVPFVLALYVSLVLSRWWALRVQALGTLFNSVSNTVMVVSCCLPDEKWRPVREQIVRFGIASIMLVVKAARGDEDIETLEEYGLLTRAEITHLSEIMPYQRATTMWIWILRVCEAAFALAKCPPPRFNMVLGKSMAARDGVQTIQTYLDTQLPFAYVHLITLLVNIQNLVMAAKCGAIAVVSHTAGDNQQMISQILMCIVVCVIYQGLLGISYVVHDPFGDDILDFPVVAYTEYVSWSCTAFERAASNCPPLKDEERLRWLLPADAGGTSSHPTPVNACKTTAAPEKEKPEQNAKSKEPEISKVKPTTPGADQVQDLKFFGLPPIPPKASQPPLPTAEPPKLTIRPKQRKSTGLARVVKELVATNKAQMSVLMKIQAHIEGGSQAGRSQHNAKKLDDGADDDDDEDEDEEEDEDEDQGGAMF